MVGQRKVELALALPPYVKSLYFLIYLKIFLPEFHFSVLWFDIRHNIKSLPEKNLGGKPNQ